MKHENGDFFHEASYIDQKGQQITTRVPVVQELARRKLDHFPERFKILQRSEDLVHPTQRGESVPSIDISKLRSSLDRADELAKLAGAAKECGVFFVTNHGIEELVLKDVKDVVEGFFGLSFEEKKACVGCYKSVDNMGYGKNYVRSEDQKLQWIDRVCMKVAPKDRATEGLHVWPLKPINFRQAVENFSEEAREIFDELLQDLAESLSLEKKTFLQNFEPIESEIKVRVNYYPPCPRPDLALGLNPHSDASGLTLLLSFGAGASEGLEVLKGEKWTPIACPGDGLVLVLGDLVEIMSNGVFKSAWHRVRTQREAERFSVALFYCPPPSAEIEPFSSDELRSKAYKKVVVDEYVQNYYRISPTLTKEAIMFAKSQ